jgi:hypothetical protein
MGNSETETTEKLSPVHMFKGSYLITTIPLIVSWVFINVSTYTLMMSATMLAGNIFINFTLMTLANAPVAFIFFFTLDRIGRRWNLVITECGLGLCCLDLAILPKDWTGAILVAFC